MNVRSVRFQYLMPRTWENNRNTDSKEEKTTGVCVWGGQLLLQNRFTHFKVKIILVTATHIKEKIQTGVLSQQQLQKTSDLGTIGSSTHLSVSHLK